MILIFGPGPSYLSVSVCKRGTDGLNAVLYVRVVLLLSNDAMEEPEGSAWVQFNIRFYVIALIFLIFDVEVVFLFPWAMVFKDMGMVAFVEMGIFLLILIVGLAYVWKKGDLDWVKYNVKYGRGRYRRKTSQTEGEAIGSI